MGNIFRVKRRNEGMIVLGIVLIIASLLVFGYRIYKNTLIFNVNCGGHLKRAADANTIDLALKEMKTALAYLEENNVTSGYTSVVYRTPDEDVGFWYTNLKAATDELSKVNPDATQLEKSNILLKLRETLLDQGQTTKVTVPHGISVFPDNALIAFISGISIIFLCIGVFLLYKEFNSSMTIVELMIVISIVGIVAAILFNI